MSSLQAIRKLTKAMESPATPIEGFQKYLEGSEQKKSIPPSLTAFKKGLSISKMKKFITKINKKKVDNAMKIWRIETIKDELYSDKIYISNQIKCVLNKGLRQLRNFTIKTKIRYFCYWKNKYYHKSPIHLIFLLKKLSLNRANFAINKISLIKQEKTKLIYHVINNLLNIIAQKFERWKLNSNKLTTELIIAKKLAVMNFKEFQNYKILEVVTLYRKAREIFLKKYFFYWSLYKPVIKVNEESTSTDLKESGKRIEKLKRQRQEHENAVLEANIKDNLLEMLIKVLNTN